MGDGKASKAGHPPHYGRLAHQTNVIHIIFFRIFGQCADRQSITAISLPFALHFPNDDDAKTKKQSDFSRMMRR